MLAILTTHPIQYQVPIWQQLARDAGVPFEVWYLSDQGARPSMDAGFGRVFAWDIDLLTGYPYRFLSGAGSASVQKFGDARVAGFGGLLRDGGVSALWINGWQVQAYWQAALAGARMGIPIWLRGESNDLARRSVVKGAARALALRALFSRVSRFLYIGEANKRLYLQFGVGREKLVPAPYCVDNVRFAAAADAARRRRDEVRSHFRIPRVATCLLFSGKLIPKKRPLDLLEAVRAAMARRSELRDRLHVLIVGDGALMPAVRAAARDIEELCGRPAVTLAGFLNQTEMPSAYAAADWLVLPSDAGETWGLVVNEALASGLPAIVSDRCGCAEDLVAPLGRRLIVPCGDVEALSRLIADVALGRLTAPDISRCRRVVAGHDVGATVDAVRREFQSLHSVSPLPLAEGAR